MNQPNAHHMRLPPVVRWSDSRPRAPPRHRTEGMKPRRASIRPNVAAHHVGRLPLQRTSLDGPVWRRGAAQQGKEAEDGEWRCLRLRRRIRNLAEAQADDELVKDLHEDRPSRAYDAAIVIKHTDG